MEEQWEENLDIERNRRRERRIEEMRQRKAQQDIVRKRIRVAVPAAAGILALAAVVAVGTGGKGSGAGKDEEVRQREETGIETVFSDTENMEGEDGTESRLLNGDFVKTEEAAESEEEEKPLYYAEETEDTQQISGDIISTYAVLIDRDSHSIVAEKNAKVRMNPASMTKVLTLLVAAEHIENPEDTVTITLEMTDYSFVHGCSNAGFEKDETVTVRDLLYGTILPSGAEAAVGLAVYTAGSQEAFVGMMNGKLEELGLSESAHFTNCVGVYDENHYCTVYDMAMILEAALDNELCREVLSSRTYTTSETEEHPEGMILSNWFLRRIEDKDVGGKVLGGKTGYVKQSGSCAASYGADKNGKGYVCVTADADSQWVCINDHAKLYQSVMMQPVQQ